MLEPLNRQALAIAKEVAEESGCLLAGNLSNTNIYDPADQGTHRLIRAAFEEQVGWAADAGVDYVIGETLGWLDEALMALEAIQAAGKPAVITLAIHREPRTREGMTLGEAARRLEQAGAAVVGLNCIRGPATMLPLIAEIRAAVACPVAALPVPYRTTADAPGFFHLRDPGCGCIPEGRPFPTALEPFMCNRYEMAEFAKAAQAAGRRLHRHLLRRGPPSHPRDGRSARPHAAGQPLHARHDAPFVLRQRRKDPAALQGHGGGAVAEGSDRTGS